MRFEKRLREFLLKNAAAQVVDYGKHGDDAMLSVPTPEHYLPLLYMLGLRK